MQIIDLTLTLPRHPTKPYVPRNLVRLRHVVWHHSGASHEQTPEAIARYHIETDALAEGGASGIAYHYLIYDDGRIYKTRPIGVIPACVAGHNTQAPGRGST